MREQITQEQLRRCCKLLRQIRSREVPKGKAVRISYCEYGAEPWWEGSIQDGQKCWVIEAATLDALETKRLAPRVKEAPNAPSDSPSE